MFATFLVVVQIAQTDIEVSLAYYRIIYDVFVLCSLISQILP